jgi:uncharacterized membrane protein
MASLHPQLVHFTIVFVIVGVAFRLVSLFGRPAWVGPAAATLLILAGPVAYVTARSGVEAHGPVERAPGAREAVVAHEWWGDHVPIAAGVLALLELAGVAFRKSPKAKGIRLAAAVVGVTTVFFVYQTAKYGGELVYAYAGGVGIRSGDPKDVERLLLAGYYHQALADRAAGRPEQAATLIAQAADRFPAHLEVQLLAAESQLVDRKNAQAAIDALMAVQVRDDSRVLRQRKATLLADAYEAAGRKADAAAALESVLKVFPNDRLRQRLDALKGAAR